MKDNNDRLPEETIPSEPLPVPAAEMAEEAALAKEAVAPIPDDDDSGTLSLSVRPITMAGDLRCEDTVNSMMTDVLIALLPVLAWAVYLFGLRPLTLTALSVIACYLWEGLGRLLFRRGVPWDLTPAVTGVILALGFPATAPLWFPLLGAAIAIFPIRQCFGGTGRNRLNPAATALAILYILFPKLMTSFSTVGVRLPALAVTVEGFEPAGVSTLDALSAGTLPSLSLGRMLVGLRPGLMGEIPALLLIGGGIYLMVRRIVRPGLPLAFIATVAALTYFFPMLPAASDVVALRYAFYHLLSGNLLLGVLFMATDPVTSPRGGRASIIAGILGGVVTVVIRYFVSPLIGVIVAVLIINLLSRPLDYLTRPSLFGGRPKPSKKKT